MTQTDPQRGTTSSERTMAVLEFLNSRTLPAPTMVIAKECSIPKSSLHNLLNTMRRRGFVVYHDEQRAWSLGSRAASLGSKAPLLGHGLAIIATFDVEPGPLTIRALAARSGLSPALTQQVVPLLEEGGLLARVGQDQYRLGLRFVALASRAGSLDQLRIVARPVLCRLRDETGETANLVVLMKDHALYVDQVESRHALRHGGWVGRQIPVTSTASGAALAGAEGPQIAKDTVEQGVTAVACAIPGVTDPPAIVSVTGPNFRLEDRDLKRASYAVEQAAASIRTVLDRSLRLAESRSAE